MKQVLIQFFFGILVGAFGIGGMLGGLIIVPRIKMVSIEKRVTIATVVFAVSMAVLSFQHDAIALFVGVFAVGTSLVVTNSSLNFVAYNSVSSWVRTRVVSVRQLVYWGGV